MNIGQKKYSSLVNLGNKQHLPFMSMGHKMRINNIAKSNIVSTPDISMGIHNASNSAMSMREPIVGTVQPKIRHMDIEKQKKHVNRNFD